jgi:deoxyribodipyrimidine photo-lyase
MRAFMGQRPVIMYFRQDLRLNDNPALSLAAESGAPILPLYIIDTAFPGEWQIGAAQKVFLADVLHSMKEEIPLVIRSGHPVEVLRQLVKDTGASQVFWNRCYEPFARQRDREIESAMELLEVEVHTCNGSLLIEPWKVSTNQGTPYKVFTQFWKKSLSLIDPLQPCKKPEMRFYQAKGEEIPKESPKWAGLIRKFWQPKEEAAQSILRDFVKSEIENYKIERDLPSKQGTSRLSPYLHFGLISPSQIWHAIRNRETEGASCFLSELGWREFSYYLLYHFPYLPDRSFNHKFNDFKWDENESFLKAWQKGLTGYPIVDAGMRQLWQTGWMHNRVRMIVASFLTKDLLIHWKSGEEWFWDTLVDADLASNAASWQWVAGTGADAAPYFRIFNPVLQGEKFDPAGDYIKQWIPELKEVPFKWIHQPWEAPDLELRSAGVILGEDYPCPIVDHKKMRAEALNRYTEVTSKQVHN